MAQKVYKVTIEPLSPIHVGSGEEYEPYNFAIDPTEKKLYFFGDLYPLFREGRIPQNLFSGSPWQIHFHLQRILPSIKKHAIYSVPVSGGIERAHRDFEEKFRQNKLGAKFQIKRHIRRQTKVSGKYSWLTYFPGSGLKGAIFTAIQEAFYKKYGPKGWWQMFGSDFRSCISPEGRLGKCLKISDARPVVIPEEEIGFGISASRFKYDTSSNSIPTYLEVVKKGKWEATLRINQGSLCVSGSGKVKPIAGQELLEIDNIVKAANDHYLPILEQQLDGGEITVKIFKNVPPARKKKDYLERFLPWALNPAQRRYELKRRVDYTPEYLSEQFIQLADQKIEELQKKWRVRIKNTGKRRWRMLLRIGLHSQSRAMTIGDLRAIEIRNPKDRSSTYWSDNETTFWGYSPNRRKEDLLPFGWIFCTIDEL